MRPNFRKIILFFFSLYIPWIAIVKLARPYYLSEDYASWRFKFLLSDFPSDHFNPEHLAIGDCLLLAGVDPQRVDPKLYNFAISGSTPIDTYFLLKRYLDSGKNPKRVYLMFGLTHFQQADVYKEFTLGFGTLSLSEQLELLQSIRRYGSYGIDQTPWPIIWSKSLLTILGIDPDILTQIRYRLFSSSHTKIDQLINDMTQTRGQHFFPADAEQTLKPSPLVVYDQLALNPLIDFYLKKTLDLLNEKGIEAVVDFVPVNQISWELFTPTFHKQWGDFLTGLRAQYPQVSVGEMGYLAPEFFSDHSHLNQRGMEWFSAKFKNRYY
jgi:hypothetical protein